MKKLNKFILKRNQIAQFYNVYFKFNKKVKLPIVKKNVKHSYHLFPLLLNFKEIKKNKNQIFKELSKKKLIYRCIIYHYTFMIITKKYNFSKGDFPVSENFYDKNITSNLF